MLHTNLPRGLEVVLPEVLVPISISDTYMYEMIVIIINREMAVDTASELEPPTPPSDGLERDSSRLSMQYYSDTRTHTSALQGFTFAVPNPDEHGQVPPTTRPLRSAPPPDSSFFDFSFFINIYYQRAVGKSVAPVLLGGEVAVAETPFVHDIFSTACVSPVCSCIIAVVGR